MTPSGAQTNATLPAGGQPMAAATMPATQPVPATQIPPIQQVSPQEAELMRLQQETQARYIQAINELQMLKVAKDIADANKDISTSKLAQVTAEKKIVDLLAPPPPPPPPTPTDVTVKPVASLSPLLGDQDVQYTVVSVSQLQYRWGAVMSYKGTLFNVHVGDILPPDGSKVMSIQRDGVTILKNGARKKISLVPTI
jgi:type IV pilus biogenesis protein PilP